MLTIEGLKELGVNTQEGLGRCLNNEALYLKLVKMIPGDANFERLSEAVRSHDLEKGFEAAHALKGALGNLSLTPLYERICEMTELLRVRQEADYGSMLTELLALRDALKDLCADS